jgi:hypothetical protein
MVPENLIIAESPRNQQHPGPFLGLHENRHVILVYKGKDHATTSRPQGRTVFSVGTLAEVSHGGTKWTVKTWFERFYATDSH